jgi:hypothetical protein
MVYINLDAFARTRTEAVISCGSVPLKYLPELVKTRLSQPR